MSAHNPVEWTGRIEVHHPAADLLVEADNLAQQTAAYQSLTEQHTLLGRVFDYAAPLPTSPNYRPREWETTDKDAA